MKNKLLIGLLAGGIATITISTSVYAYFNPSFRNQVFCRFTQNQSIEQEVNDTENDIGDVDNLNTTKENNQNPKMNGFDMKGGMQNNVTLEEEPLDIVYADDINTAKDLEESKDIQTITISDSNNNIKIDSSGTYLITGKSSDGNITVKKGTTGVVLILEDLDLASKTGATLSINKNSEVKVIIKGEVTLTDNENAEDENSTDADTADNFDGAAIKIKDGANVYLTGDGTLNIYGNAKNGIKSGDDSLTSFVIDGDLEINIESVNDAINAGYDLFIYNGTLNINAGDDAIHSDRILTIGYDGTSYPVINIESCYEGLEATIVNLLGGTTNIKSTDDAVNAANSDGTYSDTLTFAINISGGNHTINAGVDGLDSNGDVNIIGGYTIINARYTGGDAGIDYDGKCYIDEDCVENNSGIAGPDNMGGGMRNGNRNMGDGAFDKNFDNKELAIIGPENNQNFDNKDFNQSRENFVPDNNDSNINTQDMKNPDINNQNMQFNMQNQGNFDNRPNDFDRPEGGRGGERMPQDFGNMPQGGNPQEMPKN
mgnify:CR=1 FL=1